MVVGIRFILSSDAGAKINDAYYIDGGYRNNLPIDVAVQQGATECITVDVQGPGINKRTVVTEETAQLSLGSPWSLGSFWF